MRKSKSSISKARSYAEIGEFWDRQNLSNYWGKTRKVKVDVVLEPEATNYPIERGLSAKFSQSTKRRLDKFAEIRRSADA